MNQPKNNRWNNHYKINIFTSKATKIKTSIQETVKGEIFGTHEVT